MTFILNPAFALMAKFFYMRPSGGEKHAQNWDVKGLSNRSLGNLKQNKMASSRRAKLSKFRKITDESESHFIDSES